MYALRETPLGDICLVEHGGFLEQLYFGQQALADEQRETPVLKSAFEQLEQYFAGTRTDFTLPLRPLGTEFQKKVWHALSDIPYGHTVSYRDIAVAVGNPKAARAVGMANNRNPLAIFIPCHRVIGAHGDLVGYGGGLEIKQYLLNLEQ